MLYTHWVPARWSSGCVCLYSLGACVVEQWVCMPILTGCLCGGAVGVHQGVDEHLIHSMHCQLDFLLGL